MTEHITFLSGDCSEILNQTKREIDLTITSPPYNLDMAYDNHADGTPYPEYLKFSHRWLEACYHASNPGGRLCLNVPLDKNKGGMHPVYSDLLQIARKSGWNYFTTIIWNEGNISRRTAWGSWKSPSAPYVIAPVETIIVFYKGEKWKKPKKGTATITGEEFIAWTNGLWTFNGESAKRTGHPAPFPIELPNRCIRLFSWAEDTILDPFLGSGTTLIAAARNGRKAIGIDISPQYLEIAKKRVGMEGNPIT